MRKFVIHEQPHVADPAWICPVVELIGDSLCRQYSDAGELQRVVSNLQLEIGRQQGQNRESIRAQQYLEHKGWTPEQIREFLFWTPVRKTDNRIQGHLPGCPSIPDENGCVQDCCFCPPVNN